MLSSVMVNENLIHVIGNDSFYIYQKAGIPEKNHFNKG